MVCASLCVCVCVEEAGLRTAEVGSGPADLRPRLHSSLDLTVQPNVTFVLCPPPLAPRGGLAEAWSGKQEVDLMNLIM